MTDRQFLRGMSGGVSVLALAGFFWFGLGLGIPATHAGWLVFGISTAFQFGACLGLLILAARLRHRSGLKTSELRNGDADQRNETRRIRAGFLWTTLGETLLIGMGVWWCLRADRQELIWPWMGLIVSLHLIPLARLFHVRVYYVTGLAGSMISLVSFIGLRIPHNLAYLGGSMAAIMWFSAAYLVWNANDITAKAVREPWAV
jgi:ABC-type Fe3+-siderophore transport system permease subunit